MKKMIGKINSANNHCFIQSFFLRLSHCIVRLFFQCMIINIYCIVNHCHCCTFISTPRMITPITRAFRSNAPRVLNQSQSLIKSAAATNLLSHSNISFHQPLTQTSHSIQISAPSSHSSSPSLFNSLLSLNNCPTIPTLGQFEPSLTNSSTSTESINNSVLDVDCPSTSSSSLIIPLWCHLTYNPNVLKRKRTHGFLSRMKSKTGRRVIKRRLTKGRKRLSK